MMLNRFLRFSAEMTAFTVFELRGTGEAENYAATVEKIVGAALLADLLDAYDRVDATDRAQRQAQLRQHVLGDERLGPVARNIIKLWYVGIWYQLPRAWSQACGVREGDVTFTVSPNAYTQGLLWPAVGANPPGARAPGYGSWASPPEIPAVSEQP